MTEENTQERHHANCPCCRASETVGRIFSAFGPSGEARGHFRQSRVEFLKGLRTLLDERIERMSRDPHQKGSRIVVE